MSSAFFIGSMAVAALGAVLIAVALVIGRRRARALEQAQDESLPVELDVVPAEREPAASLSESDGPATTDSEALPPADLDDSDERRWQPVPHVPSPVVPASFGPRPFDDADTGRHPRVARGTTCPPPVPTDSAPSRPRRPSAPPPLSDPPPHEQKT